MKMLRALVLFALLAAPLSAAQWYVSPTGSGTACSSSAPCSLAYGIGASSPARAGDTVWMCGGTYTGAFTSYLNGAQGSPIIVRQHPGVRATIDGNDGTSSIQTTLTVQGSYVEFWDFEITNSKTGRETSGTGSTPPPGRGFGMDVFGPGTKLINLVVHDTSQGVGNWSTATGSEMYGNLIYYNGWDDLQARGSGHGIYTQNNTPVKRFVDNIIFAGFDIGIHAYTSGGTINNLSLEGNTLFNNGILSQVTGLSKNILIGGSGSAATSCTSSANVAQNPTLIGNYTYSPQSGGLGLNLGYTRGTCNPTVRDNYMAGSASITLTTHFGVSTITGNTFYGTLTPASLSSEFPSNTYFSSRPTGIQVFVRPNQYEPGRANVTIYNWSLATSVNVDLSSVLAIGQGYEIRNAQNFFAAPVVTGTYVGGNVSVPVSSLTAATPVGWDKPDETGPEFVVLIVLPRTAGSFPVQP